MSISNLMKPSEFPALVFILIAFAAWICAVISWGESNAALETHTDDKHIITARNSSVAIFLLTTVIVFGTGITSIFSIFPKPVNVSN